MGLGAFVRSCSISGCLVVLSNNCNFVCTKQEHKHDWRPAGKGIAVFKDDKVPDLRDPAVFDGLLYSGFDSSLFHSSTADHGGGGGGDRHDGGKKVNGQKMISRVLRLVADLKVYPEDQTREDWRIVSDHCWPSCRAEWAELVAGLLKNPESHPASGLLELPKRWIPPSQPPLVVARDDDRDASVGADNGCPEWVTGRGHQTKRQRDTEMKVYYTSGADGIVASIRKGQPEKAPAVAPGLPVLVFQSRVIGGQVTSGDWVKGMVARRLVGGSVSRKVPAGWWEVKLAHGTVEYLPLSSAEFNRVKNGRGWCVTPNVPCSHIWYLVNFLVCITGLWIRAPRQQQYPCARPHQHLRLRQRPRRVQQKHPRRLQHLRRHRRQQRPAPVAPAHRHHRHKPSPRRPS